MKKWSYIALGIIGVFLIGFIGYLVIIFLGNYVIDKDKLVIHSTSQMVDANGKFISRLYNENHVIVSIDDMPSYVPNAFVSIEDERFYKHHGIDIKGISRAILHDLMAGRKVEGASTITQQLAKNVFLTNEKTLLRKTKEIIIAINLERTYTKKQILEMYLNQVYFGHGVYGIGGAAKYYFGKEVSQLTLEEGANLAALLKAPTYYDPVTHPTDSKKRRNLVLYTMVKNGYITQAEYNSHITTPIVLHITQQKLENGFATYIDMVISEAEKKYNLSYDELLSGGYKVVVPIDKRTQLVAYELFKNGNYFPGTDAGAEGAFVLINAKTGGIEAAIGGRNYFFRGINRVHVKRQPGSTIKPILDYGPALETGKYTPYSILPNEPMSFGNYTPKNFNDEYSKNITMYDAILQSANIPAVWILNQIGINYAKGFLDKMDIHIPDQGLSMALGGLQKGMTPLELVKGFSTFDHDGDALTPYVISAIYNSNNELVHEAKVEEKKVYSPQTAWYMTKMLKGVVDSGTASRGAFYGDLAGKTGTTNIPGHPEGNKDAWFVGYTPEVVGAVWMGYDKTDATHFLRNGSTYPTVLFKKILRDAGREPTTRFKKPKNIIDLASPINMSPIANVTSRVSFTPFGLFTVIINWTPPSDKRQQYHIYRVSNGKAQLIDTVTGTGEYRDTFVNIFKVPSYYVVPYNPQTNQEGDRSILLKPSI
ncbi:PBP1A family penicillin-binding protein [Bacillus sp. RG28]|uniref:PBP1A family penicillin-binding protein n=1 Tax=Gottfriedia endophytica TaxID=2820819 RepID=A0A940NRC4_9BACI|nr:PBP1A family penicillin-binding protein [Gottfriedia endophytica]MBP0726869.1 PBP1A family penicillin-binding protein [Gottfriedia endophytica]